MSKRIAIVQSNYIPWKGYFDIIRSVDEFMIFDDAQYTKNDWRNRNRIKGPNGLTWLTIPVVTKGRSGQRICDVSVADDSWRRAHWDSIRHNYARARHFKKYAPLVEHLYTDCKESLLSRINCRFLDAMCDLLGIATRITSSSDYDITAGRTERLVAMCSMAGATDYISGPAARDYLDVELFERANIRVEWMDYSGYPEYEQLHGQFVHQVSIIDMLLNLGPDTPEFMKRFE